MASPWAWDARLLGSEGLFIEPICPTAGGLHVGRPALVDGLLQERGEGAAEEQVVENVVIGHGGYALSSVPAMNTSMSP